VNPADGLDDEFDWSNGDDDDTDTPCLATEHVRALYNAADDQENRLLVLALCAWGLRPNEVASLRVRQFVLDISTDEVPYITFEERKNGPGEVSLLYGKEVLEDRIAMFADHEGGMAICFRRHTPQAARFPGGQSGIALPNSLSKRVCLTKLVVYPLAKDGGRRFWYDAYSSSLDVVLGSLDEIAAEQRKRECRRRIAKLPLRFAGPEAPSSSICVTS